MKKKFISQQERFDSFKELVDAIESRYTMTARETCQLLKCDRRWFTKYIRPIVPCIYLTNGKAGSPNYAGLVANILGRTETRESLYVETAPLMQLISSGITCQKRTKQVPLTSLIKPELIDIFYRERSLLAEAFVTGSVSTAEFYAEMKNIKKYAAHPKQISLLVQADATKRTKAEYVTIPYRQEYLDSMRPLSESIEYGGYTEELHRSMFKEGYLRLELNIKLEETCSKKVYYAPDPEPLALKNSPCNRTTEILQKYIRESSREGKMPKAIRWSAVSDYITVTEASWIEYRNAIGEPVGYLAEESK